MTGRGTFVPEANSLADRVLMFFVANPAEMLTPADIGAKFGVPKARVLELLSEAMFHGALTCEQHAEMGMVYFRPEPDETLKLPRSGTMRYQLLELLVNGPQSVLDIAAAMDLTGNQQAHNLIRSGQAARTIEAVATPEGQSKRYGLTATARLLLLGETLEVEPSAAPPPAEPAAPRLTWPDACRANCSTPHTCDQHGCGNPPAQQPKPLDARPVAVSAPAVAEKPPAPSGPGIRCGLFSDHTLQINYRGASMDIDRDAAVELVRFLSLAWHLGDPPCNS